MNVRKRTLKNSRAWLNFFGNEDPQDRIGQMRLIGLPGSTHPFGDMGRWDIAANPVKSRTWTCSLFRKSCQLTSFLRPNQFDTCGSIFSICAHCCRALGLFGPERGAWPHPYRMSLRRSANALRFSNCACSSWVSFSAAISKPVSGSSQPPHRAT